MTTAQPARPATIPVPVGVRASALASWQLVEDARSRAAERRPRSDRSRVLVQRAVADRRAERARQGG